MRWSSKDYGPVPTDKELSIELILFVGFFLAIFAIGVWLSQPAPECRVVSSKEVPVVDGKATLELKSIKLGECFSITQ